LSAVGQYKVNRYETFDRSHMTPYYATSLNATFSWNLVGNVICHAIG